VKGRSGGRNAKTVQQHQLEGTFRTTRHEGIENPDPPKGKPDPPRPLTGHAKAEWDRMVSRLETSKTLAVVDDAALYQYCCLFGEVEDDSDAIAQLQELSAQLKQLVTKLEGIELVEAVGKIVELQKVLDRKRTKLRQGHMALKQMLVEFGMTPASRSRVKVIADPDGTDAKPKSPLAALQQKARVLRFGA
jgi:P27 family predicted phage terminase small subunit